MEKIKLFLESSGGKDLLVVLIVILTGLGSFELGRLSKSSQSTGIMVKYSDEISSLGNQSAAAVSAINSPLRLAPKTERAVQTATPPKPAPTKIFFASNRGKKYYSLGCSAGKTIKVENRIYFNSASAAESAGYTMSSSCK